MRGTVAKRLRNRARAMATAAGATTKYRLTNPFKRAVQFVKNGKVHREEYVDGVVRASGYRRIYQDLKRDHMRRKKR